MALDTEVGSFALNTGTGNQSVTGVGFQPKAIIFFLNRLTADGYTTNKSICVGFATSSSQRGAVSIVFIDTSFSQGTRTDDTECILVTDGNGALLASADFVSFDAGGFTINVTDAPPSAYIVNYLALGGSDLTNATVGNFPLNTGTGSQGVTGVGFQPDCVLFLHGLLSAAFPQTSSSSALSLGAAVSSSERAALSVRDNNTNPTQAESLQLSNRCIVGSQSGAIDHEVDFTSMDTDGFTLNVVDAPAAAVDVFYLALKGGNYKVGVETQKTSTGTKATTGVGFLPEALLFFGTNVVASASLDTANDKLSIGAAGDIATASGSHEGTIWGQSTDALSTSDANSRLNRTKVFGHSTNPSTTDAEAELPSFDSDGFTLNWTTADGTAREFIYVAMGNEVSSATLNKMTLLGVS